MYPRSIADIFENLTSEARAFILDEIKGSNKESKSKLLRAFRESVVETKNFPAVDG